MWTAKFSYTGKKIFFGNYAKKHSVKIIGQPTGVHKNKGTMYLNLVGRIVGTEKNIHNFIKDIKKSSYVLKIEENKGFINIYLKETKKFWSMYDSRFVYVKPVIITEKGIYFYELGSWDKKPLMNLFKFLEKHYDLNLESIEESKIRSISILGLEPNLTDKQRKTYYLATEKGYYDYPKKITIKKLAKLLGVSYSTCQQNLSYAEKKVSHFYTNTD